MAGVSDLDAHAGYWMRMVSNAVTQEFAQRIASENVTVAEWAFMRMLYDAEAMPPSVLAARMDMTRGAISKLADRLQAKGLVRRTENRQDKRAHTLSLSAEGRTKVPVLASLADMNDAEFFGALADEERACLDRILRALVARRGLKSVPVD